MLILLTFTTTLLTLINAVSFSTPESAQDHVRFHLTAEHVIAEQSNWFLHLQSDPDETEWSLSPEDIALVCYPTYVSILLPKSTIDRAIRETSRQLMHDIRFSISVQLPGFTQRITCALYKYSDFYTTSVMQSTEPHNIDPSQPEPAVPMPSLTIAQALVGNATKVIYTLTNDDVPYYKRKWRLYLGNEMIDPSQDRGFALGFAWDVIFDPRNTGLYHSNISISKKAFDRWMAPRLYLSNEVEFSLNVFDQDCRNVIISSETSKYSVMKPQDDVIQVPHDAGTPQVTEDDLNLITIAATSRSVRIAETDQTERTAAPGDILVDTQPNRTATHLCHVLSSVVQQLPECMHSQRRNVIFTFGGQQFQIARGFVKQFFTGADQHSLVPGPLPLISQEPALPRTSQDLLVLPKQIGIEATALDDITPQHTGVELNDTATDDGLKIYLVTMNITYSSIDDGAISNKRMMVDASKTFGDIKLEIANVFNITTNDIKQMTYCQSGGVTCIGVVEDTCIQSVIDDVQSDTFYIYINPTPLENVMHERLDEILDIPEGYLIALKSVNATETNDLGKDREQRRYVLNSDDTFVEIVLFGIFGAFGVVLVVIGIGLFRNYQMKSVANVEKMESNEKNRTTTDSKVFVV